MTSADAERPAAEERVQDITSNTKMEVLQARLAAIVESSHDAIIAYDLDGAITSWNPAAERLFGYTSSEIVGRQVSALVPPELTDEIPDILKILRCGESLDHLETVRITKDGRRIDVALSVSPVRDEAGIVFSAATIARDITDRKRAEAERERLFSVEQEARERAEAEQHRVAFLAGASGILARSLDYQETLANVARLAVSHLGDWCAIDVLEEDGSVSRVALSHPDPQREEFARRVEDLYPTEPEATRMRIQQMADSGPILVEELTEEILAASARDEKHLGLILELGLKSAMALPLMARDRVLGVMTLLTAESGRTYGPEDLALASELGRRSGMAVENARLYYQAQRALKLREDFLSIASHELKTPLTSLQLQVQMLSRYITSGNSGPDRQLSLLDGVGRQLRRLSRLINELLDVSRISAGKFELDLETVDLAELVGEVVDRFEQESLTSGSTLRLEVMKPVSGQWDRFQIDQVITNLVSNAIKYGQGEPVDVVVDADGHDGRVVVRDRGRGIPKDHLGRVFDRFERVDLSSNYGGLGLGLYIARQIVDAHGGEIDVASEIKQGTTFTVRLPLTSPSR